MTYLAVPGHMWPSPLIIVRIRGGIVPTGFHLPPPPAPRRTVDLAGLALGFVLVWLPPMADSLRLRPVIVSQNPV